MHALLGELTQDIVEQVNLQNVHNMENFTQNGNVHYDNMAKQLSTLNKIINKLVSQICQPVMPNIGNHFQTKTIVGHNPPVLSPNQGIEPPFGPSTSNQGVVEWQTRMVLMEYKTWGDNPNARDNVQTNGQNTSHVNDGENAQANGNIGLNNGIFVANQGPNIRPQTIPPMNQPLGVPYDPNVMLRNQIMEIMQDQMAFGARPFIRPTYTKSYPRTGISSLSMA